MTSVVSGAFESVSEVFQNVGHNIVSTVVEISEGYEQRRAALVELSYAKLPECYAYVVDRISKAVPEIFAALSASMGGILVVPALIVTTARRFPAIMPIITTVLRGDFQTENLTASIQEARNRLSQMFDEALVPAVFVAMTVDAIASFIIGYISFDFSRMLRATTISLPVAILSCGYMLNQRNLEEPVI